MRIETISLFLGFGVNAGRMRRMAHCGQMDPLPPEHAMVIHREITNCTEVLKRVYKRMRRNPNKAS